MAALFSKTWKGSRCFAHSAKETVSSESKLPNVQVTSGNGWRKAVASGATSYDAELHKYSSIAPEAAIEHLNTSQDGLTEEEAVSRLHKKGPNLFSIKKPPKWWQLLLSVIPTPFNALLTFIAVVSVSTPPPQWSTFLILAIMIVVWVGVQFWQEYRSSVAAIKLQVGVSTDVRVRRRVKGIQIDGLVVDVKTLVPGDILLVDPGDSVPTNCMIIKALLIYRSVNPGKYQLTGTLTKDEIALCHHVDVSGDDNSKNSIDSVILRHNKSDEKDLNIGKLAAEIPFNFESRRWCRSVAGRVCG